MKRILSFFLCLTLLCGGFCIPAHGAAAWPSDLSISAEGGIVMDADSGAVLYGKNMHTSYYPASITKILTALIVIEHCNMDEVVTFSRNAIFNVEPGSTSAGMDVGDQLTVRDCLYALLLRSANEVANALAEHVSGSMEAFAGLMNEKASSLGCTDSHFNNPSGLNDPDHYTSAYDMALIAQAAFQNDTFVTIDSTLYYDLPPTKRNPDGFRIYPGHRMLKKNAAEYYSGIIGGKTGYTSLAGNTLVTCAQRNGMKLIAVVLNGHQTHYTDTRKLLDFGFQNFQTWNVADLDTTYSSVHNDMSIAGLPTTDLSILRVQEDCRITLPDSADFSDVISSISYDLGGKAPEDAIAQISYEYNGHSVGAAYLIHNELGALATEPAVEVAATEALADMGADGAEGGGDGSEGSSRDGSEGSSGRTADGRAADSRTSTGARTLGGSRTGSDPTGADEVPADVPRTTAATSLTGENGSGIWLAEEWNEELEADRDGSGQNGRALPGEKAAPLPAEASADGGAESKGFSLSIPSQVWIVLAAVLLLAGAGAGVMFLKFHIEKKEEAERTARYRRRQARLKDIGMSTAEFDLLMEKKRSESVLKQTKPRKRPKKHRSFLDAKR